MKTSLIILIAVYFVGIAPQAGAYCFPQSQNQQRRDTSEKRDRTHSSYSGGNYSDSSSHSRYGNNSKKYPQNKRDTTQHMRSPNKTHSKANYPNSNSSNQNGKNPVHKNTSKQDQYNSNQGKRDTTYRQNGKKHPGTE